jgi:hypothetical protein
MEYVIENKSKTGREKGIFLNLTINNMRGRNSYHIFQNI